MIVRRSVEQYLQELEEILRRYRVGLADARASQKFTLGEAQTRLRKLGFTNGEALSLLRNRT